jgi:hypothetical protein
MYNNEDDNQAVWQQFMAEIARQTSQPEVSDGVDRGELRSIPKEMLENNRPYTYNPDQPLGEGVLTLLAGNTATANDAQPRGLNAYRASGASVQPAKSAAEIYNQLHPEAATRIQRFFELADERGLGLKPGSMNRDYGTQAKMYADKQAGNRGAYQSLPVSPPGSSTHMGFATDFSGYTPQKLEAIRELAREVGLVYGGNWSGKTFDPVHIQLGPGSDVTRYIQQHIDPKAGTVNWEGVRSTALPEDFLKRAIAAAQGQNVDAIYVPTKEVKVEGASNATGSATVEPDAVKEADAKVEVTQKRKDIDFAKLIKMLDDSTHGGADYLSRSMQANAQQAQANRSRSLAQIAQFDQEQVNKMAEALKGGAKGYKEGGEFEEDATPNLDKLMSDLMKERTTEAEIIDNGFKPRDYDPAKITQALSIMSGNKDPSTQLQMQYMLGKLGLNAGVSQSEKFRGYNAGVNIPLSDTSSVNLGGNYGRVMGAYGQESPASWGVRGSYVKRFAEGGPKLPDRPEYEITDTSNAVDATPSTSLEQLFQTVTGGRNLQNDLSNIKSRLPTGQDYGHALLEQRDSTQAMNEQGRQNLREGYANRDITQMLLGTGQGVMGLVNPAMAPINAGFEVLSKTAGKFDPRAKVEAEALSLAGSEGMHLLPKSSFDMLVKKYEHATSKAPSNFDKWFGESKMINEETGKPLRVYHGSSSDIESFRVGHPDQKDVGWLGRGVYTTTDPDLASSYSLLKRGEEGRNIMPLHVKMENPYYATQEEKNYIRGIENTLGKDEARIASEDFTNRLRREGYDGVILHDPKSGHKEIVSFQPSHVKSATGNRGTWDIENPKVNYADGGLVTDNGQTPDGTGRQHYDAYGNVSDAQGGPVRAVAYDQDRVNTLAQQLNEGTYG